MIHFADFGSVGSQVLFSSVLWMDGEFIVAIMTHCNGTLGDIESRRL